LLKVFETAVEEAAVDTIYIIVGKVELQLKVAVLELEATWSNLAQMRTQIIQCSYDRMFLCDGCT